MRTEEFIEKAKAVHGEKYDYSLASYGKDGRSERTTIICPDHGPFTQRPKNHLAGHGCTKCTTEKAGESKRLAAADEFVSRARAVHGARYEYLKSKYVTSSKKLIVTCRKHGDFEISPNNHLWGKGCRACMGLMTEVEFLLKAFEVHGDRYDYTGVKILRSGDKVKIGCEHHGIFEQGYSLHLNGSGCPGCSRTGYDRTKPGTFYVLKLDDTTKIGITNRDVSRRINQIKVNSGKRFEVVMQFNFEDGSIPITLEAALLKEFRTGFEQPEDRYDGSTECFLNLDPLFVAQRVKELTS